MSLQPQKKMLTPPLVKNYFNLCYKFLCVFVCVFFQLAIWRLNWRNVTCLCQGPSLSWLKGYGLSLNTIRTCLTSYHHPAASRTRTVPFDRAPRHHRHLHHLRHHPYHHRDRKIRPRKNVLYGNNRGASSSYKNNCLTHNCSCNNISRPGYKHSRYALAAPWPVRRRSLRP